MWGSANWGELIWGGVAIPTLPDGMLPLLALCYLLAGAWFLRPGRRGWRSHLVAALVLVLPLSVAAVTLPHTFVNGTVADADEVNANFAALATAANVETCPAGMTRASLAHTIICYASGPVGSWDQASNFCSDSYGARICSLQQWRDLVCRVGVTNPGASWTDSITGSGTAGVVSGCSGENFASAQYTSQRVITCCAEWARY
jgi:hypothetical protein